MWKLLFLIFSAIAASPEKTYKNTCNTCLDYLIRPINRNCWYNPDVGTDMPELAEKNNFIVEKHKVITKDGYILTLFRLPNKMSEKVVFLQHSVLTSCTVWVDKGNQSLGYMLHKEGYDVWLGNFRGSFYSREHTSLNPNINSSYWDFSFHEMGIYDIPSQINFIINETKAKNVITISHGLAASSMAVYASLEPEEAEKNVKVFITLSPVVFLQNTKLVVKSIAQYADQIYALGKQRNVYEVFARTKRLQSWEKLCYETWAMKTCINIVQFLFTGSNWNQVYPPYVPLIFSQNPAGTSLKTIMHFIQNMRSNSNFNYFDYYSTNPQVYNSTRTPCYPLEKITSPFRIYYGTHDYFADEKDIKQLINALGNYSNVQYPAVKIDGNNGIDFIYGRSVKSLYQSIIDFIKEDLH